MADEATLTIRFVDQSSPGPARSSPQQLVGQRVEFDSSHGDKGLRAANIQPAV